MQRCLTVSEAAEYMGCSKRHMESLLPDVGAFDMARAGSAKRMIRIPVTGLESYIQRHKVFPDKERNVQRTGYKLERRTDK